MSATTLFPQSIETLSPFRHSPANRTAIPARVKGEIPSWVQGDVVRTCPVIFETPGWRAQHWFDGLGMIYAFRIQGSAVDFRSCLLDSEAARDASLGKANLTTFGTPTKRGLLQRILEPVARGSDNTNVNIVKLGDELVAMTEGVRQLVIDDETLAAAGTVEYAKGSLDRAIMSAHPHFDFERAQVLNVATQFGANGVISIYEHAPGARQRQIVASWRTNRIPYVHTFGLTPRNAILVAHPFSVAPKKMLFSNKGYIDHFNWKPEEGTRLVVMDRATGAVREHVTNAFFVFHTVNAYERGDETVLDLLAYPNVDIVVSSLRIERMIAQLPDLRPSLIRVVMRPGVEHASIERLSDVAFEFPSTNYRAVSGKTYRFAWGASDGPRADGAFASSIVKVDVQTGASTSFNDDSYIFGEPLFVSRPQGDAEDDGVLLSVGSAKDSETSVLAVIDAKTMTLLARAEVPSSIPLGFHGSFVRKGDLR